MQGMFALILFVQSLSRIHFGAKRTKEMKGSILNVKGCNSYEEENDCTK